MKIRKLFHKLIGERTRGRLAYFPRSKLRLSWGAAFNGQKLRQGIFVAVVEENPLTAIIETGTFRGTTTELLARTLLPVYTVEAWPRFYEFARMRFRSQRDRVHVYEGDSRAFLRQLAADSSVPHDRVFFYLDAHWGEDLPLLEEVGIIFKSWTRAIVMIDDFKVPGTDYQYDDYGSGKALTLEYLERTIGGPH